MAGPLGRPAAGGWPLRHRGARDQLCRQRPRPPRPAAAGRGRAAAGPGRPGLRRASPQAARTSGWPAWPPLPGTGLEAKAIAEVLTRWAGRECAPLLGERASEVAIKSAVRPRVVVMCTHAYDLNGETHDGTVADPLLRCGLVLAGANRSGKVPLPRGDDGILTALEILGLDLRPTELVILSACESGLGQLRFGEGVAGLRQAFQLAGARAVVATLWKVPDAESRELTTRFFEAYTRGPDAAAALGAAQRALIRARREDKRIRAAHPYFWAAYTTTGGQDRGAAGGDRPGTAAGRGPSAVERRR
ncbi:MAG: CHAT domain-containing protein [Singulisphaera sp.]